MSLGAVFQEVELQAEERVELVGRPTKPPVWPTGAMFPGLRGCLSWLRSGLTRAKSPDLQDLKHIVSR